MNEVSNTESKEEDKKSNHERSASRQKSEHSMASASAAGNNKRPALNRLDSEFGLVEREEDKNVIVSPKSLMISSRLAEPETADIWSSTMLDFVSVYKKEI